MMKKGLRKYLLSLDIVRDKVLILRIEERKDYFKIIMLPKIIDMNVN